MRVSTPQPFLSRDPTSNASDRAPAPWDTRQVVSQPSPKHDRLGPAGVLAFRLSGERIGLHEPLGWRAGPNPETNAVANRLRPLQQLPCLRTARCSTTCTSLDLCAKSLAQCSRNLSGKGILQSKQLAFWA